MSEPDRTGFDLSREQLLASALHAQLLARRRATLEHDIKNVVHGLMSGTELLAKSLSAPSARITPAECLTLLQQQLGRVQATLGHIVDEVAPAPQPPTAIELAEIVAEATHALRHPLQSFDVQLAVPPRLKARASRVRLKDALLVTILDCVDRAPPRAAITIRAEQRPDSNGILLTIEHPVNPAAPSPTVLDAIDPLLALDEIRIDTSTHAQGRRVQLSLTPFAESAAAKGLDVLIVDANPDAADSLAMLVGLDGLNATACYETASALATINDRAPAAVVIDLDGSVDVRGFVRTIRSAQMPPPRIVGVSYAPSEPVAGVDTVLRKPLDVAALRRSMT